MERPATDSAFDVAIVGAGAIGLATAWTIAREGGRVALVERDRPGEGASRVAAGMLAPVAEVTYGEKLLLDVTLRAAREFPDFVARLEAESGREVGLTASGALHIALDRDEAAELRRRHGYLESLGFSVEWLGSSRCREMEPGLTASFHGGLRIEAESIVDPRLMSAALVAALGAHVEQGDGQAQMLLGHDAVELVIEGDRATGIRLDDGQMLRASYVVDACGCHSGSAGWIPEEARVPVRPVKGQILELAPGGLGPGGRGEPVLEGIVGTGRIYLVPRPDGRLMVGATVEEQGFDTSVTAGGVFELLREAYRAVPEIAEMRLVEAAAGLRPATPDNLPYIGEGAIPGLIHATGHYRNGILLAPITAEAVAGVAAGRRLDETVAAAGPDRLAEAKVA